MIVVDTHSWFWWLTDDPELSPVARGRLNREREVVVPAICLWEVAMMATRGRVDVGPDIEAFLGDALEWEGVRVEPVSPAVAVRAATLSLSTPLDPGDQMVAATAMHLKVPVVTRDSVLRSLPGLKTFW